MGRKKALLLGWLTRGVRLAAAARGSRRVRGREQRVLGWLAGSSAAARKLGWLAGTGAAARKLGWLAGRASRAGCEASFFLFVICFSSSLFELKFDLEFEFKSGVSHPLDF